MRLKRMVIGVQKEFEVQMHATGAIMLAALEQADGAKNHHRRMIEAIFPMRNSLEEMIEDKREYLEGMDELNYEVAVDRSDYYEGRIGESLFGAYEKVEP